MYLKTVRKTFATGNAINPLPRTIIQITNDNSIFRKEGIYPFPRLIHEVAQQVGPIYFKTPRKCNVFGVCSEGSGNYLFIDLD
jgi:hypothetical protein